MQHTVCLTRLILFESLNSQSGNSNSIVLVNHLSYFFLLKNLLVVVLSAGNMWIHYQDCKRNELLGSELL